MIRISRPNEPDILLDRGATAAQELCAAFDSGFELPAFDRSIYAHPTVKEALRQAQHGKCAFCESFVLHIAYGDVEHFRPKAGYRQKATDPLRKPGYFWLAYAWENLLFVCQLCNQRFKRNHFPLRNGRRRARPQTRDISNEEPLFVDPSRLDPADYIGFREEAALPVNGCREGKLTIEALGLDRDELRENRRRRLEDLENLRDLCIYLRTKVATAPTPGLTERVRIYEHRLRAKMADSAEYAAMARAFLSGVL